MICIVFYSDKLFFRQHLSQEEHALIQEKNRLAHAQSREALTPEQKITKRASATAGEQRRRDNMTPEERAIMNRKEASAKKEKRHKWYVIFI